MSISRVDAGTPDGGQFAASARPEPGVTLPHAAPSFASDTRALNAIALLLGESASWDGSADYLESAANLIASTGRPHPGDTNASTYRAAMRAWKVGDTRGDQRGADTRALDRMAVHLAATPDWSADELDVLAHQIEATGRPQVGDRTEGEYSGELRRWQVREGVVAPTPADHIDQVSTDAGLPVMASVLETVCDRGDVDDEAIFALSSQDVTHLYEAHVGPAASRANAALEAQSDGSDPDDAPFTPREAQMQLDLVREDADADPLTVEMLTVALERGELSDKALWNLEIENMPAVYDQVVGPTVDAVEDEMRTR